MIFLSCLLGGFIALLAIPSAGLLLEVIAASFLPHREINFVEHRRRDRIAVIVPAHDESSGIQPTLEDIKSQLRQGDRLVVVADNCTDDTAAVAKQMGAEVTVRTDTTQIGKGYALDWGLRFVSDHPPEIVIIVDADCRVSAAAIDRLAFLCSETRRPVQALYLMGAANGSAINHQVAEFAWRLKNWVRPLGLSTLNLPCQLMGTGMAFPWDVIRSANLASGFIAEDLKLGLELALMGYPPVFCPSATVTSTFPTTGAGAWTQRQRWEQGHIGLILTTAPALIYAAFKLKNWKLLVLPLDLIVPPISLFITLLIMMLITTVAAFVLGITPKAVLMVATFPAIFVVTAITLAWLNYARDILPLSSVGLIGNYFVRKLRLYGALLAGRRATTWIRSDRNSSEL
jgi:cellulose synthase/poly-beta-1,6-N-acetylglucosamine synthase-like glycosyltransferase